MVVGEEKKIYRQIIVAGKRRSNYKRSNILLKMAGYISTRGLNRKKYSNGSFTS